MKKLILALLGAVALLQASEEKKINEYSSANAPVITHLGSRLYRTRKSPQSLPSLNESQTQESIEKFFAIYTAIKGKPALVVQNDHSQVVPAAHNEPKINTIIDEYLNNDWHLHTATEIIVDQDGSSRLFFDLLPDGRLVASSEKQLCIVDPTVPETITRILRNEVPCVIDRVLVAPNNGIVWSDLDHSVMVDQLDGQTQQTALMGHTEQITGMSALPNGTLVSCSFDNTIRLWNLTDVSKNKIITETAPIHVMKHLSDGHLAFGLDTGELVLYDADLRNPKRIAAHQNPLTALTQLDSTTLLAGHRNGYIVRHNLQTEQATKTLLNADAEKIATLEKINDTTIAYLSSDYSQSRESKSIKIQDLGQTDLQKPLLLCGHTKRPNAIKLLKNGDIASSSADKTIRIWHTTKNVVHRELSQLQGLKDFTALMHALHGQASPLEQEDNIVCAPNHQHRGIQQLILAYAGMPSQPTPKSSLTQQKNAP